MMSGLYKAHHDPNVSIPSGQSGVVVPFLGNDDNNDRIDYTEIIAFNGWYGTGFGLHGTGSYNASTQVMSYGLETDFRTMGEYVVAINELHQLADDYENINIDYVTRVYDTKISGTRQAAGFSVQQ